MLHGFYTTQRESIRDADEGYVRSYLEVIHEMMCCVLRELASRRFTRNYAVPQEEPSKPTTRPETRHSLFSLRSLRIVRHASFSVPDHK